MGERRVNPETGVVEERDGWFLGVWQPASNESGAEQRVNPDTGVIEERYGSVLGVWQPASNESGAGQRVNPDSGVIEERYGSVLGVWQPASNESGAGQRVNPDSGVIEERYGSVLGVWQPTTAEGGVQLIRPVTDDVRKDSGSTSGDFREAPTHNSQWPTSGDNDIAPVTATCIPYSSARHAGGNQRSGAFGRMLLVLMIPVIIAAGVALSFGIFDKLEYMSTSATARVDPAVSSASSASEKHPVPLARVIRSSEVIWRN
jgi:hypothetical protein